MNDEGDVTSYDTPRPPNNDLACAILPVDAASTNINGVSVHWTDVSDSNDDVKYQRQYSKVGSYGWSGNEIYDDPYTNYRSFGSSAGSEAVYGSRVRAWIDDDDDNVIDTDEIVSEWSNDCYVEFDKTAPAVPTGLQRLAREDHSIVFACGDTADIRSMHPDWDDNTEDDFSHYEYTSFNTPNGNVGIDERVFTESIFEYNGGWLPIEGTYGFNVRAVDKAGNKSDWALGGTETFLDSCQISYDGVPAQASGMRILDHNGANLSCEGFTNNRYITVDWANNTESDINHYDYMIREGNIIAHPTVSEYSGNIRNTDGYYKYQVRAVDDANKIGEWSGWCGVTLDRELPVSVFSTPTDDVTFDAVPVMISGSTTDNHGAASVELAYTTYDSVSDTCGAAYTSITSLTNIDEDATYDWSYDWTPLAAGAYCITAHGSDIAGNVEASPVVKNIIYVPEEDIVLNEFLPKPAEGNELVEIYNVGDAIVDVSEWYIADSYGPEGGKRMIDDDHTDTGSTIIEPGDYLVIQNYSSFYLNDSGDTIKLFNNRDELVDSYEYGADEVLTGKSIARDWDNSGAWVDPIPTFGSKNNISNDKDELREYYNDKCFDKKERPVCDKDFMEDIGLLDDDDDDKKKEEKEEEVDKKKEEKIEENTDDELDDKKKGEEMQEEKKKEIQEETLGKEMVEEDVNGEKQEKEELEENKELLEKDEKMQKIIKEVEMEDEEKQARVEQEEKEAEEKNKKEEQEDKEEKEKQKELEDEQKEKELEKKEKEEREQEKDDKAEEEKAEEDDKSLKS